MAKSLLIVESPTKVNTLKKIVGKDFIIKASVGHLKDLPKKTLGVDVDNGFAQVPARGLEDKDLCARGGSETVDKGETCLKQKY